MGGKRANEVDVAVGHKIRLFRLNAGLSQTELADQIDVTFQQVQKYEKGANRVGAGRLTQIAAALNVPIPAFFEGFGQGAKVQSLPTQWLSDILAENGTLTMLRHFAKLSKRARYEHTNLMAVHVLETSGAETTRSRRKAS